MKRWTSQPRILSFFGTHLRILTPSELNHLLQICSNSTALKQGRQVHQQIILHGLGFDSFMATKLIQMYADCNDFSSAHILFEKLPRPNVFAWTAILALYSRNGMYHQCLSSYREMQVQGVRPDGYVFPKVLRACAQSLSLEEGIRIHKDIIRFGAEYKLEVCNSLIDMYSKCGDAQTAREVFDKMVERDILSWNSMISGYVCNESFDLAMELLGSMRSEGLEPDLVTLNTIVDGYCRMGLCEEASEIFEQIKEPNIISWTTLMSGYSRIGKYEISIGIFRKMMFRGLVLPDAAAISNVILSCRHLGALRSGREIHGYGIKTGSSLKFYNSAGAALLIMYARCGRFQDTRNVFALMDKHDIVTWNAMILGFVLLGRDDLALTCFRKMQSSGIRSDQITLSTVLPICDLQCGKQMHALIWRNGFDSAISVWNSLINMYSKCGSVGAAYTVFSNMETKDVVSWNTIIGAYGIHGQGRVALELLQEMKNSSIQPNPATFTSVLTACSHSGLVDEGLQLFNSLIQDFDFFPSTEHFACIVDSLGRAGRLEEAVRFINKMPIEPDRSIWGSLLAACRVHQNIDFGRLAAEHLFHLEPENPGNYITLSNIYARAGRWDDAVRVRKLMEDRGLMKPSGYSWIQTADSVMTNETQMG
ncbi:pentatricopeptide repeat-containing protein DOT4, chloroplastic-like [Telopea speciosissima]|uniref:pentatricopeptide repeat-containing protein DOT4, chloroplastic-like n=1 Tax=Telopea speciosissima TaxID=54955 RepID=UPI001CC5AC56|nr:pentatricopeptide repeat-containing protein DOT4, chloroplastic-like [Telopea speciosissima]